MVSAPSTGGTRKNAAAGLNPLRDSKLITRLLHHAGDCDCDFFIHAQSLACFSVLRDADTPCVGGRTKLPVMVGLSRTEVNKLTNHSWFRQVDLIL